MMAVCALGILLIASFTRGRANEDSLSSYWISMTPEQQDATCNTYMAYPDFAQNSLVGLLHNQISAKEAHAFLWSNCG